MLQRRCRRCCLHASGLLLMTVMAAVILTASHLWHRVPHQKVPVPREDGGGTLVRNESPETPQVDPIVGFVELQKEANDSLDQQLMDNTYRYYLAEADVVENVDAQQISQPVKRGEMKTIKLPKLDDLADHFPRFMIIGFGKAGTKALYEALKLHPSLSGPYKERRFFSSRYSPDLVPYLNSLPSPSPGGYTIEKSPDYIIHPQAPSRIVSAANKLHVDPSKMKFIVVLRNPIDRAVSEYIEWNIQRQKLRQNPLPRFHEMVIKDKEIDGKQPFLNTSCYAYHIAKWMEVFPREQLCYVDGDRFITDPYIEVHKVEECMGLHRFFTVDNFVYVKERGFYCFQTKDTKSCMDKSKGRKHPDVPDDVVMKLKHYFRTWNDQLPALTGRQFTDWETVLDDQAK